MAFIETRLLDCIGFGSSNGPTWRTRRISLKSGIVRRNPLQAQPLYRFLIRYNNLSPDLHAEVLDAFNSCLGGVHSFRFKDWQDFSVTDELLEATGTGSSQVVQLTKEYIFGSESLFRNIRKPVSGTVSMTANGSPISPSIDYATGLATLTTSNGAALRWTGEFDVPVMFEADELPFSGDNKGVNGLFLNGDVALIEDRSV